MQGDKEDFFGEDFDFKPITKGLGFHHSIKDKNEVKMNLEHKSAQLKKDLDRRSQIMNEASKSNVLKSNEMDMGDLTPFYKQEAKVRPVVLNTIEEKISTAHEKTDLIIDASGVERFGAWFIDMIIISSLIAIAIICTIIATATPLSYVRTHVNSADVFRTLLPIFLLFYTFYFSFFDKTIFSTPGKKMLNIKVVNLDHKSPTMVQAMLRAILTLVSAITLGLLVMLDVQSKLTDTKVIKA